jgi:anthranilate 1,2-dioxygenase large subunit
MTTSAIWPRDDYSRVPYRLYHDEEIYRRELARVFHGPTWSLIGLEAEIPSPGDFRASFLGDTPVIVNRDRSGVVHAFVNRCAHRGAIVRRENAGNADNHICIYHQWCFAHDGSLTAAPFRRGVKGKGGLGADFDLREHGLTRLRVESVDGALFGTLAPDAEPLHDYLGPAVLAQVKRLFARPIRILGYHRQRVAGNWKMYAENQRDNYHASMLHEFLFTFGLDRATQKGGSRLDARHRHNITYAEAESDDQALTQEMYGKPALGGDRLALHDPGFLAFRPELPDNLNLAVTSIFPNAILVQINNALMTRQIRPKAVGEFEVYQTLFGYADDSDDMVAHRLRQANLFGPSGYVSMEDAEAIEITYRASRPPLDGMGIVQMGGAGPITDLDYRLTDVPVRGFWSYYAELMDIEPAGAVR